MTENLRCSDRAAADLEARQAIREPGTRVWNEQILDRIANLHPTRARAALNWLSGYDAQATEQAIAFAEATPCTLRVVVQ